MPCITPSRSWLCRPGSLSTSCGARSASTDTLDHDAGRRGDLRQTDEDADGDTAGKPEPHEPWIEPDALETDLSQPPVPCGPTPVPDVLAEESAERHRRPVDDLGARDHDDLMARGEAARAPVAILAGRGRIALVERKRRGNSGRTAEIARRREPDALAVRARPRQRVHDRLRRGREAACVGRGDRRAGRDLGAVAQLRHERLRPERRRLAVVVGEQDERRPRPRDSGVPRRGRTSPCRQPHDSRAQVRRLVPHRRSAGVIDNDDVEVVGDGLARERPQASLQRFCPACRGNDDRHERRAGPLGGRVLSLRQHPRTAAPAVPDGGP